MMRLTKLAAFCGAAAFACLLQTPTFAQSGPQDLPPVSFTGNQYVDQNGCVYVRAGVDNAVRWVPRVTPDRRQVCGFEPTFPATEARAPATATTTVVLAQNTTTQTPRPGVPADSLRLGKSPRTSGTQVVTREQRFLPDHMVAERAQARSVVVPKGYRTVWDDDRLNLQRAEQTKTGQQKTQAIWTNTVPRRLVE